MQIARCCKWVQRTPKVVSGGRPDEFCERAVESRVEHARRKAGRSLPRFAGGPRCFTLETTAMEQTPESRMLRPSGGLAALSTVNTSAPVNLAKWPDNLPPGRGGGFGRRDVCRCRWAEYQRLCWNEPSCGSPTAGPAAGAPGDGLAATGTLRA